MRKRSGRPCRSALRPRGVYPVGLVVTVAVLTHAGSVAAQTDFRLSPIPIDTFTLANGLHVIVSEDHSTPVVAVSMWYYVGSAHEPTGRSGFAHLFEHLLFEETENLDDGELDRLITQAGGVLNGTTDNDRTAYFEILPANRLNLALWAHAERMDRLVVTERGLETQREVVKEERRFRIDNQPYAHAQLALDTLATDYPPYRHLTIGTMDDLDAATAGDALDFYERYYVPNNAVLAVVGDVTPRQVRTLTEEYFGAIPRGTEVPSLPPVPTTPRTDGERRLELPDPLAQLPRIWMAYNTPPADHPDAYALDLLVRVLSGGESSRLERRLVQDEQAALAIAAFNRDRLGGGMLTIGAIPNVGVEVERIEELVAAEIVTLQEAGITDRELRKAKNQERADAVTNRLRVQSKGNLLQAAQLHYRDPFRVNNQVERYEAITLEDLRRVARTYLTSDNQTVVIARPAAATGR